MINSTNKEQIINTAKELANLKNIVVVVYRDKNHYDITRLDYWRNPQKVGEDSNYWDNFELVEIIYPNK